MNAQKSSQTIPIKPKTIRLAVWLILIAVLILGPISDLLDWDRLFKDQDILTVSIGIASQLVIAIFTGWLVYKIAQGRNWARITFLIIAILAILPGIRLIYTDFEHSMFLGLVTFVQNIMQLLALYLIFSKPGSLYFKKERISLSES